MPPTTIGRRPAASSASISAWASSAKRPALNSSVDGHEAEQAVLQALALVRARLPRQHLEPLVDLERVAGDRDGVLAALAQQLGELDGDAGLADRGGPEDREDVHGGARTSGDAAEQALLPASVVEVAAVISTSTISPASAVPSKFTVLLWRVRPRRREASVRLGPSTSTSIVAPDEALRALARAALDQLDQPLHALDLDRRAGPGRRRSAASVPRRGEKMNVKAPS